MRLLLTRPWTEQDESLLGLLLSQHTVARVARRLRRSESSVRSKGKELGLKISANSSAIGLQRRSPSRAKDEVRSPDDYAAAVQRMAAAMTSA